MEGDGPSKEQKSVSDVVFSQSSNTSSEISSCKLLKHKKSILNALLSPVSSFTSESSDCKLQENPQILPPSFIFTFETPKNSLHKPYQKKTSYYSSSIPSSVVSESINSKLQVEEEICKSDISSSTYKVTNSKPRKHVAVILTSSESENEADGEPSINVIDCNKECSGDAPEPVKLTSFDGIKNKNTHCTVIPDLDEHGECADIFSKMKIKNTRCTVIPDLDEHGDCVNVSSNIDIEMPRFPRQLDFDKWTKKKEKEARRKKKEQQKAKQNSETLMMDEESAKHNAWVNWMCRKKNDEMQKKIQKLHAKRMEESEKEYKDRIAKQKFEDWVKKKKENIKRYKQENKTEGKDKEGPKKLTKNKQKWEEWYAQTKDKNIPKSFTHISYPKPAWVNPVPWSHPDPTEYLSLCADLDD